MSEIFGYTFVDSEKKRRLSDIAKRPREIKKNLRNLSHYIQIFLLEITIHKQQKIPNKLTEKMNFKNCK